MWTEEQLREYTRQTLRNNIWDSNPSAIVAKSFYKGNCGTKDRKYDKQYSIVKNEIQLYSQTLKK